MNSFIKNSASGNLKEATSGLVNPKLIMMYVADASVFESKVAELEELFPGVPSIGCIAMAYDKTTYEKGVSIIAFTEGVEVVTGVIRDVSTSPVKSIPDLEKNIKGIKPGKDNTVMIDFCTGNDACVLTTIHGLLEQNNVALMGGTGDAGKVSCNGKIFEDSDAYALVKNLGGKVKVFKENIYKPMEGFRFIASDTDRTKYYVGKLNGKSAKAVYSESLGIPESQIKDQTFQNPLGKMIGKDICIISLKDIEGEGLSCFRQVNDSDVLTLLKAEDINVVVQDTLSAIKAEFKKISCVFSVNCVFRYIYLNGDSSFDHYLGLMSELSGHCGYVGYGEHCNSQFVNQSMSCVVFE